MKNIAMLTVTLSMLMVSFSLASEGITGTAHDFKSWTWSDGEICKPCHTPHNAIAADLTGRLWNHELSTATYTLHGNTVLQPNGSKIDLGTTTGGQDKMDGLSRLCLSCHDGTVALDSFGGRTGSQKLQNPDAQGGFNLGTNLNNDHPVGLSTQYDEMKAYSGHYAYQPLATVTAGGLRLVDTGVALPAYVDRTGTTVTKTRMVVGCTTCHDVHNGAGFESGLLRGTNSASKLCLSCHAK